MKNRNRELPTFANINLLGKCNADCYFCLGRDLPEIYSQNQLCTHFLDWDYFIKFLELCRSHSIKKLYITGQNTDSLLYKYLGELIRYLQADGFSVGLRTNGYLALEKMDEINLCDLSVGYTINTLVPWMNHMIMGREDLPDWERIIPATNNPRVQIVVNDINKYEIQELLFYVSKFKNVKYIQVRRISTDNREEELKLDIAAYDFAHETTRSVVRPYKTLWDDCLVYRIFDKDVCFWRTVKTSVNSFNYFTDGTISDEYFIVEGYQKNKCTKKPNCERGTA